MKVPYSFHSKQDVLDLNLTSGQLNSIENYFKMACENKEVIWTHALVKGYPCITLHPKGWGKKTKRLTVHIMVMLWAGYVLEDWMNIDHIDGNPLNFALTNLRICTVRENSNNPITLQRCKERGFHATQKANRRLTLEQVHTILNLYFFEGYTTVKLGEMFNCNRKAISFIVHGKNWKNEVAEWKEKNL